MENGQNSSSKYPQTPHRKVDNKSGEKKDSYSEGRYNRDKSKKRTQDIRDSKTGYRSQGERGGQTQSRKPPRKWKENLPPIESDDQITEGKLRGLRIAVSDSPKMAPTGRKLREVLFRILYRKVRGGRFLDLCAGAGSVGIDAISRGALLATMVERKAKHCSMITKNLVTLDISEGHGEVVESELVPFLKQMSSRRRYWDVVYFAPPYDFEYDEALAHFERGVTIKPGGVFVIEHHAEMFFPESIGVLKRWKVVVEDESALSFYDRRA